MATNGEPARGGGVRGYVDDEGTYFDLELALAGHHLSADDNEDEKELAVTAAVVAVHGGDVTRNAPRQLGPAGKLRALVRKLKAALRRPAGGGSAAALEDRCFVVKAGGGQAVRRLGAGAVTGERPRSPKEAAVKSLGKTQVLARRRGVGDGPDPSPPFHRRATALPGRRSSGGETRSRKACKRRLGISRSSVAASSPPRQRRDDSLLQAQDGIERAIAHCKLSLDASSRGSL